MSRTIISLHAAKSLKGAADMTEYHRNNTMIFHLSCLLIDCIKELHVGCRTDNYFEVRSKQPEDMYDKLNWLSPPNNTVFPFYSSFLLLISFQIRTHSPFTLPPSSPSVLFTSRCFSLHGLLLLTFLPLFPPFCFSAPLSSPPSLPSPPFSSSLQTSEM